MTPTSNDNCNGGFVKREVRVGVLASGRGSNFEALQEAASSAPDTTSATTPSSVLKPEATIRVVCLGTDNPAAPALELAARSGIASYVVHETASRGRLQRAHELELAEFMSAHDVDLVCLAGFMRIVRGPLLERFADAILNIHPSLLPSFPGLRAPQQALEHGVRISGCTVHFVDSGIDTGPILLQAAVPVVDTDTVESLTARIQEEEHRIYPQAVRLWASGDVRIDNRRVVVQQNPTLTTGTPQTAGKEEPS